MSGEEAQTGREDEASAASGSTGGASADDEVLSRLEERLDRASETAERLLAQAAQRATRKVPPAGWQQAEPSEGRGSSGGGQGSSGGGQGSSGGGQGSSGGGRGSSGRGGRGSGDVGGDSDGAGYDSLLGGEVDLLLGILGALRDRIPAELQQRLADALREVLLAIRALIDWYLERSERRRRQPAEVQDIPIL